MRQIQLIKINITYNQDTNNIKSWREIHNLQINFDDFEINGYGKDFYGSYKITGTSNIQEENWKLEFKLIYINDDTLNNNNQN